MSPEDKKSRAIAIMTVGMALSINGFLKLIGLSGLFGFLGSDINLFILAIGLPMWGIGLGAWMCSGPKLWGLKVLCAIMYVWCLFNILQH